MLKISTSTIFIGATLIGVSLLAVLVASGNNSVEDKVKAAGLPLKIEEYFDYACPHCQDFHPTMEQIITRFGQDVQVEYVFFNIFPQSLEAAYAAEAAREQGKFIEYHNAIFSELDKLVATNPRAQITDVDLVKIATDLKLDMDKFNTYRTSDAAKVKANEGKQKGGTKGVTGTPSVFINGVNVKLETKNGNDFSPLLDKVQGLIDKIKNK
jgi:protein-disulfide isomerase